VTKLFFWHQIFFFGPILFNWHFFLYSISEAPIINFIRRNRPRINHSCLRNVLSDTEDKSDGRAAASKIKVTKKFLKISFQLHSLFENYNLSILLIL